MLQPIAFNVIRQALVWHDFPVPVMRQLSFYEWEDCFSAEYGLTWAKSMLEDAGRCAPGQDGDYCYTVLLYDLRDCFADDVTVVQCHWDEEHKCLQALLYVQLQKTPYQLALLPGGDDELPF